MEGVTTLEWFLLFFTPVTLALIFWRVQASKSPTEAVRRALAKIARAYKGQLFFALPCETYADGKAVLGTLAVLDGRLHFESVLGDQGFDVNYPRIRAYLFQQATSSGFSAAGMRVLLISTDTGHVDFGVPAWGEEKLSQALRAASGRAALPSPK